MSELNPELVEWNKINRARRQIISAEFERNMERPDVRVLTDLRQTGYFSRDTATYHSFLQMKPYELEARLVAEELQHVGLYRAQKARAKRQRLKIGETNPELWLSFLANFLRAPQFHETKPSEIWSHLYAKLKDNGCSPSEIVNKQDARKTKLVFELETSGGKLRKRTLSYGRFLNLVTELRSKT